MDVVAAASEEPAQPEDASDSEEENYDDDIDLVSSEDSGTDDSSDEEEEEGKPRRPDLFPDPLSLIDHAADLNSVLKAKSIGDAIQILCPNLPGGSEYS